MKELGAIFIKSLMVYGLCRGVLYGGVYLAGDIGHHLDRLASSVSANTNTVAQSMPGFVGSAINSSANQMVKGVVWSVQPEPMEKAEDGAVYYTHMYADHLREGSELPEQ